MNLLETRGPWRFGRWSVTQIVEWEGEAFPHTSLFPNVPLDELRAACPTGPQARLTDGGMIITANQFFVIQGRDGVAVVEFGTGNDKSRPAAPYWDHQKLPYAETLASLGVALEDVRFGFMSHGHLDHVGLATTLVGDRWSPTFPNASYIMDPREWAYWGGLSPDDPACDPCIDDSIRPLVEAGAVQWASDGEIIGGLRVHAAPGHTPGNILLELVGTPVWFVGDLLHHPAQVSHPEWPSADFDLDRLASIAQTRKYLPLFAQRGAVVFAMHTGDPFRVVETRSGCVVEAVR